MIFRELSLDQVRLLPPAYPLITYDNVAALHSPGRKRLKSSSEKKTDAPIDPNKPAKAAASLESSQKNSTALAERKAGVKSKAAEAGQTNDDEGPSEAANTEAREGLKVETKTQQRQSTSATTTTGKTSFAKKNIEASSSSGSKTSLEDKAMQSHDVVVTERT